MNRLTKAVLKRLFFWLCVLGAIWFWVTQPVFQGAVAPPKFQVDPEKLKQHVLQLSTAFAPRDRHHLQNLNHTADYIRDHFRQAGGRVSEQLYKGGDVFRNVVASFGPETRERLIIGAHYDAFDEHPGADDNASGVAGLLELARLFQQSAPAMQVDLVAYSLEEPPFFRTKMMGSYKHAAWLKERGVSIRLMVSLEMIGYFSDAPNSQDFPIFFFKWVYPDKGNFIAVVGRLRDGLRVREVKKAMLDTTSVPVRSFNAPPMVAGIDFSDHLNYWEQGYPAVMITDTAFFRNRNYHTPEDTAEKLDYERMAQVVTGVFGVVMQMGLP